MHRLFGWLLEVVSLVALANLGARMGLLLEWLQSWTMRRQIAGAGCLGFEVM